MLSTDTRTGFRRPWSLDFMDHEDAQSGPEAELMGAEADADVPFETQPGRAAGWPDVDVRSRLDAAIRAVPSEPKYDWIPAPEAPAPRADAHRRPTKFLADLTAAMRAAAESGREQTLARFQADAKQVVISIHEVSATEATTLRKAADENVAGIRDWSKAEIARIRAETDAKIAHRKVSLESELGAHAGSVELRIGAIQGAIAAFESEMAAFFEQLFAETDPAAFAALAERMPEPPSIEGFTNPDLASEWSSARDDAVDAAVDPRAPADQDMPHAEADAEAAAALQGNEVVAFGADELDPRAAIWAGAIAPDPAPEASADGESEPAAAGDADTTPAGERAVFFSTWFPEGQAGELQEGETPLDGFEADGTPLDRSAIMATLDAAAEAAAESAARAEEAAGLAETAAELLSSRVDDGEGWGDLDSAKAEAALSARMDAGGGESGSFVNRLAGLMPRMELGDGEPRTSQIVVTGLVSVASIASFKRHLGRLSGVSGVTVSSGPDVEFVFSATHRPDISFLDVVPSLPGFGARVTHAADGVVNVTARDPESDG